MPLPILAILSPVIAAAGTAVAKAAGRYITKQWRWGEKKIEFEIDIQETHKPGEKRDDG